MSPPLDPAVRDRARAALSLLEEALPTLDAGVRATTVGRVTRAGDGVARATGLERAVAGELVDVEGAWARVEAVRDQEIELVLLSASRNVEARDTVRRTWRVLDVPAGIGLVGRVMDALGRPLDGRGPLVTRRRTTVYSEPIPLRDREPVSRPLRTGALVVDAMVPIGRGQRQLIIGDRGTGKTSLCLDILAALDRDVIGIYVAIGRRGAETAAHLEWLRQRGFFEHGLAVVADADDPIGLVHLAPYAATAMAEDLMLAGRDVVIVYDDLTTHANAHRSLALLLDRPVAREAFPADIFYAHARMLERATQLARHRGGGSLTALPIVETQAGDLTGYIPTNLVSITDGQVRLDAALATAGQLPAVDVGLSVSRVGGKAQIPTLRNEAGTLKNRYAQFLELESFTRFGTRLEAGAREVVEWGKRVRRILRQDRGAALSWGELTTHAALARTSELMHIPVDEVRSALNRATRVVAASDPVAWTQLQQGQTLTPERARQLWDAGRTALREGGRS